MTKLARLKKCLTPHEAARQLTLSLAEPCSPADVLQLGLDRELVLSVRFSAPVQLLLCSSASGPVAPERPTPHNQAREHRASTPAEIWDLPLIGSERSFIRRSPLAGTDWKSAIQRPACRPRLCKKRGW
jgi:hypothetical protein